MAVLDFSKQYLADYEKNQVLKFGFMYQWFYGSMLTTVVPTNSRAGGSKPKHPNP